MPDERATIETPDDRSGPNGWSLLLARADGTFARVRIPANGDALIVGRDATCQIRIHDDSVSRKHARIAGTRPPMLADLGSRNGTRIGGERLASGQTVSLRHGTSVEFGSVVAVVQPAQPNDASRIELGGSDGPPVSRRAAAPAPAPPDAIIADEAMRDAYAMIDVLVSGALPVMILGETGVGKDVYAEAVHKASSRASAPFLRLNCAALAESLLEAELFGFERGAFTGAVQAKPGLFESADGGTIFLDEVGEMPLPTQAKLLRVLENGEVLRIGSVKPRRVDVRFISATHKELDVLAERGEFRTDLYYRLHGIAVWLPPLRQRKSEIVPLAKFFLSRAGRNAELTPEVEAALIEHRFPGNVRELRNVIERAAMLARGGPITKAHLVFNPRRAGVEAGERAAEPPPATGYHGSVAAAEKAQIIAALASTKWNRKAAAKHLGISRTTLQRKIQGYGLVPPSGVAPDDE